MSVADRLGAGSSFKSVPRAGGRSARGRAKAVVLGDVPAYELVRLQLDRVAPTPLNPRRNFGTDEEKTRFGEELRQAQLAACVAVTRAAYLTLWPEQGSTIGDVDYVLVNGERRYRSAVHVGLEALDFVVRDDLAASREDFVNHLLKENLEREDFDVIERARGVQQLVDVCGDATGARARAAERLGRDRSWVTNQLALLRLPDEVQVMLSSGEIPERDGRQLARHYKEHPELSGADLVALWKDLKLEQSRKREEEKALLQAAKEAAQQSASPAEQHGNEKLPSSNAPASPVLPSGESGVVLSADNTTPDDAGSRASGSQQPEGSSSVLSADNTERREASPKTAEVPRQQPSRQQAAPVAPRDLVRQLGETPADQARTLAEGLGAAGLITLIEELHSYV